MNMISLFEVDVYQWVTIIALATTFIAVSVLFLNLEKKIEFPVPPLRRLIYSIRFAVYSLSIFAIVTMIAFTIVGINVIAEPQHILLLACTLPIFIISIPASYIRYSILERYKKILE